MDHFINNLVLTYYCLSFTHISHKRHGTTLVRKSWHAPIQITMETTRHYSRTRRLLQESESKYDWWSIWRHRHDGIFCKKAERSLDDWWHEQMERLIKGCLHYKEYSNNDCIDKRNILYCGEKIKCTNVQWYVWQSFYVNMLEKN